MTQKLFIVSRGDAAMYEQLRRALIGEPELEIIYDRRDPKSQKPLRGVGDRRMPSQADIDLRVRGWAVIGGRTDAGLTIRPPLAPPTS